MGPAGVLVDLMPERSPPRPSSLTASIRRPLSRRSFESPFIEPPPEPPFIAPCFEEPSFIDPPFIDPPSMPCIAFIASGESGRVSPGTLAGAKATPKPRTASRTAIPRLASAFHGRSFSTAINAAMNAIQPRLITPSANSAAISAQQQPTHQPPCVTPMRRAPSRPGRHLVIRNMSGLRQWRRQTSFNGVSW